MLPFKIGQIHKQHYEQIPVRQKIHDKTQNESIRHFLLAPAFGQRIHFVRGLAEIGGYR
jgi:hypothetical protein